MNREEIIKWLESLKAEIGKSEHRTLWHYAEAIDMAIEALSTDAVDRPPRTVKLTEGIEITLDEEAYEIGYTHGQMADRPQGEWILVKGSNGKDYHKCSKCLHTQEITGVKNYCAVCGAIMKGGDDE